MINKSGISNPYGPPSAKVSDQASRAAAARKRPRMALWFAILLWVSGFAVLFGFNAIAEVWIMTVFEWNDTLNNDLYFQLWWLAVAGWSFAGLYLISSLNVAAVGSVADAKVRQNHE